MDDASGGAGRLDVLSRRVTVLERLCDGPAYKRDLVEELDQSRSTINRAVRELQEADFVDRAEEGFVATAAGRLAFEHHGRFREDLADIVDAEAVVAPLSADAPLDVEAVTGATAALAADPAPYRALEGVHDDLADARRYRGLLPALDDARHVRLLYEHVVTDGRPAEVVVDEELLGTLRAEFPRRTAAMADAEGFRLFVGDVPPFAVLLVDVGTRDRPRAVVDVVVFTESGGVHGSLRNRSAAAVAWAERRYEEARSGADERTADLLDDDPEAVAETDREWTPSGRE